MGTRDDQELIASQSAAERLSEWAFRPDIEGLRAVADEFEVPWAPVTPPPGGKLVQSGGSAVAIDFSPDANQKFMFVINQTKCSFCGGCAAVCPAFAIDIRDHESRIASSCTGCGACVLFCPLSAITADGSDAAAVINGALRP